VRYKFRPYVVQVYIAYSLQIHEQQSKNVAVVGFLGKQGCVRQLFIDIPILYVPTSVTLSVFLQHVIIKVKLSLLTPLKHTTLEVWLHSFLAQALDDVE